MSDAPFLHDVLELLRELIKAPSFSREENATAEVIANFLVSRKAEPLRRLNNIYAYSSRFSETKRTILLNSHHDTVRPSMDWTRDPFLPEIIGGKLYGLGSNDAGGSLVSLLATFLHFQDKDLPFNLLYAATAEEEIAGSNGIECLTPTLGPVEFAIVGEPTTLNMAIAERGLMVLDCICRGKSGHAARFTGDNAIERAMPALQWIMNYQFPKVSELLGRVKMTVTQIAAGTQHNVIPDRCEFVVDIRLNDCYSHQEVFDIIAAAIDCEISARSMRLKPSAISLDHPLVAAANRLDIRTFSSPTMSDQALLSIPSVKIGPGMSERSHTADEFIAVAEINDGINCYISLLNELATIYETLG